MKKLAVVSGGSKGIGKAIVGRFLNEGFAVASCSRNLDGFTINHPDLYTFKADMAVRAEVVDFADSVKKIDLPLTVLVNNAGVFIPGNIFEEPESDFEIQLNTNLLSAYYLTRALIQDLKQNAPGHIFNIGSIAGLRAYPKSGSYSVSKFALLGFSKGIREELKENLIKVTSILPGAVYTDSWAGTEVPESRFMKAEDIAELVWAAYSLSPAAVVEELVVRPLLGDI